MQKQAASSHTHAEEEHIKLYQELADLVTYINLVKQEITMISEKDLNIKPIDQTMDQLDAIIHSTENATNTIMESAETIEQALQIEGHLDTPMKALLTNEITKIYEACGFQDLTGQRITKVITGLKYMEQKINALLHAFSETPSTQSVPLSLMNNQLLNGPQLPKEAKNQDEIDAILGDDHNNG